MVRDSDVTIAGNFLWKAMTRNGIGIRTAQVRSERLVGQIHVYDGAGR